MSRDFLPGDLVKLAHGLEPTDADPGDTMTFPQGMEAVVIKVDHETTERGPYQVIFMEDGHFLVANAWLKAADLVMVRERAEE